MRNDISPELVLVSPDLRERAMAALPPVELDASLPPPPSRRRAAEAARALRDVVELGLYAAATAVGVVLLLTLVADALR